MTEADRIAALKLLCESTKTLNVIIESLTHGSPTMHYACGLIADGFAELIATQARLAVLFKELPVDTVRRDGITNPQEVTT